jgi:hypothetical protein
MTPADRDELARMIARALAPLREQIDAIQPSVDREIERLKARDAKHSGEHRFVTAELVPAVASKAEADTRAIVGALGQVVTVVNEIAERQARTDQSVGVILKQTQAAQIQVIDKSGTVSIRPASMVAAEASTRTEQATAEAAKQQLAWQRRAASLLVVATLVGEVLRAVFFPHH